MKRTGVLGGAVAIAVACCASPAAAATFEVNSAKDRLDANLADSLCADANGRCTLRAAVAEANDTSGADEINVPAGDYLLTRAAGAQVSNDEGDLDLTEAVRIAGAGRGRTVIEQTVADRVFRASAQKTEFSFGATLTGLTVRGGDLRGGSGGGILNQRDLVLSSVTVAANRVTAASGTPLVAAGGGVAQRDLGEPEPTATLTIEDSVVRDNFAKSGRSAAGGGVSLHYGAMTLAGSRVTDNASSGVGGGLYVLGIGDDSASIERTTIARNRADTGGGLEIQGGGELAVAETTVSGNVAGRGSGLEMLGREEVSLTNSTVAKNSRGETPDDLAAIQSAAIQFTAAVPLTLTHATIARNPRQPAIRVSSDLAGAVNLRSSIVAARGSDCVGVTGEKSFVANFTNVLSDASCAAGFSDVVANPVLGDLAANGGPTRTLALRPASPAIDLVVEGCPPPATDQRGIPRAQGDGCDAGAYEREAP